MAPILEALKPQVHAKGTDYTVDTVPERAVVTAYGGRTEICGDPKEHATTDLIGIILDRFGPETVPGTPETGSESENETSSGVPGTDTGAS